MTQGAYPRPGPIGGRLIRELIRSLRAGGLRLPLDSHILCAVSGGSDSVALALLVAKYGRRVGGGVSFLHVNHGWRGHESDGDEKHVRRFGKRLGVPVIVHRLDRMPEAGESWEDAGRRARKAIFRAEAAKRGAIVLTAHTADDLAETVLWRIFTGRLDSHGEGIRFRHEAEVRPFLAIRKNELRAFLEEEAQSWREDSSNHEGRFLRSRLRRELIPVIESLFPQAHRHLVQIASSRRGDLDEVTRRGNDARTRRPPRT